MAFTARTTATFGEIWTAVAGDVRITMMRLEVIMRSEVQSAGGGAVIIMN